MQNQKKTYLVASNPQFTLMKGISGCLEQQTVKCIYAGDFTSKPRLQSRTRHLICFPINYAELSLVNHN